MMWLTHHLGPLLLLPSALLSEWSGIDVPEYRRISAHSRWDPDASGPCDYDRACDVDGYAGVIEVGHGEGLVLADEPSDTAWLPTATGGVFARWVHAESAEIMNQALASIPSSLDWHDVGRLRVASSEQTLFNSAEPGAEPIRERMIVDLAKGEYTVSWSDFRPDLETAAILIELRH